MVTEHFDITEHPHRRLNLLTGEWTLVSPHRTKRPWQGKVEDLPNDNRPIYDEKCYLCPQNKRADGDTNPNYTDAFVFVNDFSALLNNTPNGDVNINNLLIANAQKGICKVISFSPKHNLTLAEMQVNDIAKVVKVWQQQFAELSAIEYVKYIQIFENKGDIMGCSNPHPHGQIWASDSIPNEIIKETETQEKYFTTHKRSLLSDYVQQELALKERIIYENDDMVVLVPFWAVWPYETMIVSKRHVQHILMFNEAEKLALADAMQHVLIKYDNVFKTSFPYSGGMHQQPVNNGTYDGWHWHMHFYPPLLRSATVKKFMVGYEMLANPQRDVTPEWAATQLRNLPSIHYKQHH
jgi:UDPglucose--hexose-1-phosphate uridylyltransferase